MSFPTLPMVAREIALQRGASIVLLQILRLPDGSIFCEDCASLRESDGRSDVLTARVAALREMLEIAERELVAERTVQELKARAAAELARVDDDEIPY